ncbi:alpha-xylosidase, partial [bacterium]|nr:alpha-xylosidase [bacterium]
LVAPFFENTQARDLYLPPGKWIDYQTGSVYQGGWHRIEHGHIPVVVLVRDGSVIPHIALAQSTADMDWSALELVVFADEAQVADGLVFLPSGNSLLQAAMKKDGDGFALVQDPAGGKVKWNIRMAEK